MTKATVVLHYSIAMLRATVYLVYFESYVFVTFGFLRYATPPWMLCAVTLRQRNILEYASERGAEPLGRVAFTR